MKKIFLVIILVAVGLLGFGSYKAWNYYQETYVGEEYYAVIKEPLPAETTIKDMSEQEIGKGYQYVVDGYTVNGKQKKIDFEVITTGEYKNGEAYAAGTAFKIEASKKRVIKKAVIDQEEIPAKIKNQVLK